MSRRTNPKLPTPRDLSIFERVTIRGERQTALASELGLSKQRVNRICDRVGKLVFQELADDFSEHRQRTLLRLEHVYSEALTAWETSKAGRSSVTESTSAAGQVSRSTTRHAPVGDVRFLTEARQTVADIRELCGLDATKTEVQKIRDESKTFEVELANMSDEELAQEALLYDLVMDGTLRIVDDTGGRGVKTLGDKTVTVEYGSAKVP